MRLTEDWEESQEADEDADWEEDEDERVELVAIILLVKGVGGHGVVVVVEVPGGGWGLVGGLHCWLLERENRNVGILRYEVAENVSADLRANRKIMQKSQIKSESWTNEW